MTQKRRHQFRKYWLKIDETIFRKLYPDYENAALAHYFGRSVIAIAAKASLLGLRKSESFIMAKKRELAESGKKYRFAKGHTPTNKGKSQPTTGRMAETQFRKGHKPKNWVPVGSERLTKDGYLQRKITDTGYPPRDWVSVHHLIWTGHNGSIPAGHVVAFKDGNKTNLRIENLELISFQENMKRNSLHSHFPPEIRKIIRLRGALNRKINSLEKQHEK